MKITYAFAKILTRRRLILLIFGFVSLLTTGVLRPISWADDFPSREIKLIVPYDVGGSTDMAIRICKEPVEKILGFPMVVVNNPAGGGAVGTLSVAKAKPDGYTLVTGTPGNLITKPILNPELPYRHTDFTAVCIAVGIPAALFVRADAPWKSLKELVDYAKKNPAKLRASTGIAGGGFHVLTDLFKAEAGIDVADIPTTGGSAASTAVMGGHVEFCMDSIASSINFLRAGRLRALVSTHKVPGFPMIKTFEEEGYPGVSLKLWTGVFGPKGLPQPVLTKLTRAFERASKDPSLQEQLGKLNTPPEYLDPEQASKRVQSEYEITLKILKQSGMVK